MADTPTPGAAAELSVVGYAIRESDQFVWADTRKDRPFAKAWRAVVYETDAQAQLDALREEVARLTAALDVARSERDCYIQRLVNERQPTDVDALMALAKKYAEATVLLDRSVYMADCMCSPQTAREVHDAAREALRAKLAARKEEL